MQPTGESMIDHVSIGVCDISGTKHFYDVALEPFGYKCLSQNAKWLGYRREAIALWIGAAERPIPPDDKWRLHFCFTAPARRSVDAFHAAALRSGGRDSGEPRVRGD